MGSREPFAVSGCVGVVLDHHASRGGCRFRFRQVLGTQGSRPTARLDASSAKAHKMESSREFSAGDLGGAKAFLTKLRGTFARVYVDELDRIGWRFVFADRVGNAMLHLGQLTPGRRFRLRGFSPHVAPDG